MADILLRFVEGAGVALYRHEENQGAELIAPRRDLYDYSGGYAWGCGGAGPVNLSYAIVGKVFEFEGFHKKEIHRRAGILCNAVIKKLESGHEYDMPVDTLRSLFD